MSTNGFDALYAWWDRRDTTWQAPRCTISRTREYRPAVALWYWAERTADYVCQQHLDQLFDQADREESEPHCVQWLDGSRTLVAA